MKHVKRSPCRKFFDKSSIENNDDKPKSIICCKLCNDELTFHRATTVMIEHLKRKYPIDIEKRV